MYPYPNTYELFSFLIMFSISYLCSSFDGLLIAISAKTYGLYNIPIKPTNYVKIFPSKVKGIISPNGTLQKTYHT